MPRVLSVVQEASAFLATTQFLQIWILVQSTLPSPRHALWYLMMSTLETDTFQILHMVKHPVKCISQVEPQTRTWTGQHTRFSLVRQKCTFQNTYLCRHCLSSRRVGCTRCSSLASWMTCSESCETLTRAPVAEIERKRNMFKFLK